jgi:hypothetical protein
VLASTTATVVALNAETLVEALLRFTLPLAAAGLWWVGITAERDDDPDEAKQLRRSGTSAEGGDLGDQLAPATGGRRGDAAGGTDAHGRVSARW